MFLGVSFIHNLMHRHRGLVKLIDDDNRRHDLFDDPYLADEPQPAKSRAMDSSLWEIKSLCQHVLPQVGKLV
jgi:U3 small nucleolar RNA-associated protein 19